MRLTGLASGLDVDSMVKELMKARQTTYNNMVKKRTLSEWKQEDFRSASTKIVDFRNNKLSSYTLSNAISAKTSQVSGDTNALTVNSTNSTAAGTLSVSVTSVATAATDLYTFADPSMSLKDLGFAAGTGTPAGQVDITINGKTLYVDEESTLDGLAKFINQNSGTFKAVAVYDGAGKLSLSATQTGASTLSDVNFPAPKTQITAGNDASVTVNGITYGPQASNRFNINGVDFTVKAMTQTLAPANITAVQDTSKIVETIKAFVADYNSLIGSLNSELSEAKFRNFAPLSSEEKAEMNEDDIKTWQDKARSGALKNDSTLSRYVSDLRLTATSLVAGIKDGDGKSLSIGITTGSYSEKGKLVLDETALRNALESNPSEVTDLFSNNTTGVFRKMTNASMDALTELSKKAGTSLTSTDLSSSFLVNSTLSQEINQMKIRESAMVTKLNRLETQYYKQFTAMETAINRFNSQSGSLSSFM